MPAPNSRQQVSQVPIKMVGGVHFGRYNKISDEQTWNMIVSDNWMVPYAGYKNICELNPTESGRGAYASYRSNLLYVVIGDDFYATGASFEPIFIGNLFTNEGDVFIAENNNSEIAITDNSYIYVWNYSTQTFSTSNPISPNTFTWPFPNNPPGYISFQEGLLIVAAIGSTNWALSGFNNATTWSSTDATKVGSLQSKPDYIQAVVPVPGTSNNVFVFGRNVIENWQFVGGALFPYQRNSSFNVDYGCINPSSIASLDQYIVWIAVNEQSGPVLMVARGTQVESISTDGIDYKLGNLTDPSNCTGFLFQQDGHLLYQFTFITDNISYAYDFNTKLFFSVSDESLNYHIARQVVYFNNTYYFVSLNGGNIYEFDTIYPTAEYRPDNIRVIPRIRITPPFRLPNEDYFIANKVSFTIEQGQPNLVTITNVEQEFHDILATESLDFIGTEDGDVIGLESSTAQSSSNYVTSENYIYLSLSRDGGVVYGSALQMPMYPTGIRKNKFNVQRLGIANDVTYQWRFVGTNRFTFTDGEVEVYQ